MTKLEQFAMYLPYGVECLVDGKHTAVLNALYEDGTCCFFDLVESDKGFYLVQLKLIPLEKADEYIHNEFVKLRDGEGYDAEVIDLFCFENMKTYEDLVDLDLNKIPHNSFMWLVKNHYDVYNMIEEGTAVAK